LRDVLPAIAVGLGAYLWLDQVNGGAWPGHDQAQSLVLVQDCVQLSVCHLTSVDSGLRGFTNGAVWLHILTAVGLLGGTTVAARALLLCLMAVGIGALFLCTKRWLRPAFALPAALFALAGLTGGGGWEPGPGEVAAANLVDASALFFPATICACALLIFVATNRTLALVVAAVFASHCTNTHVAGAVLIPSLLASAALVGRSPIGSVALAAIAYVATTLITSPMALMTSLSHLTETDELAAVFALAVLLGACAIARSHFLRLDTRGRALILAVSMIVPLAAAALILQRPMSSRYLVPVLAPLAVVAAGLMVTAIDRIAGGHRRLAQLGQLLPVALGVACVLEVSEPAASKGWTFEDGRALAEHVGKRGWCYAQQFARIQGPQCNLMAYAVIPYACHASPDDAAIDRRRQLRIWRADATHLPPIPRAAESIATGEDRVIVVSEIDSWIDKPRAELCVTEDITLGGEGERRCRRPEEPDADPFLYSRRLSLGFEDAMFQPPLRMIYSFPIEPTVGETRQFLFSDNPFDHDARPRCGWQVTRATGLTADPPLPANPVRLTSANGARGLLVIERVLGGAECSDVFPGWQIPCHWETVSDDPRWMQEKGF